MDAAGRRTLASILRFDRKLNSYKFALVRALNDIVLAFPDMADYRRPVAVPLRTIASRWVAYYWPFADPDSPIYQGPRTAQAAYVRNDIAFRPELVDLRREWEQVIGTAKPADGFFLTSEMQIPRKRAVYPLALGAAYDALVDSITKKPVRQPIQYVGPGGQQWSVFPRPVPAASRPEQAVVLPGTNDRELCVIVDSDLWEALSELSIWVEALCIHEWCLFAETIDQGSGRSISRGAVYTLLTDRPDNSLPPTWERNQVRIFMMEGEEFRCPWTGRVLGWDRFDLDHIVPVAVYPSNELWNLVPSNPAFNRHRKRDLLPSQGAMQEALPVLQRTYDSYLRSPSLAQAIREDASGRFSRLSGSSEDFPAELSRAVEGFISRLREGRLVGTF